MRRVLYAGKYSISSCSSDAGRGDQWKPTRQLSFESQSVGQEFNDFLKVRHFSSYLKAYSLRFEIDTVFINDVVVVVGCRALVI